MKNEILEEVWRNRDAFAKRCNCDLGCMMKELRKVERDPKNPVVHAKRKSPGRRARSSR
jgi:hypothetical protein